MSTIDYEKLKLSILRLQEQHDFYHANEQTLSDSLRDAVIESCIKRFEYCYATAWKHLKKYLEGQGLEGIPNSPNGVFKHAAAAKAIEDQEIWFQFTELRINTAHDYSGEKADRAVAMIADFLDEVTELYNTISP